jgi:hypothetical protein
VRGPRLALALLFPALAALASAAHARDLWTGDDGDSSLKFNSALETFGFVSAPSTDPSLEGLGASEALFGRIRLEAVYSEKSEIVLDAAYDNRMIGINGSSLGISSALLTTYPVPFRLTQIGGNLYQSGNTVDYEELDRASFAYQTKNLNLTIGRQAIGWGRGTLFSAVDIFAPFTPLQLDKEWRSGVDAARADIKTTATTSLDLVSAWGPSWSQSALGARFRGYEGNIDEELLVAKRAQDVMYGATSSVVIGDLEAHGEFALFQTPGDVPDSGMFGNPDLVPKALLGFSNNFNIGTGLKILLEYHYSGFGVNNASQLPALLANPDLLNRFERGDSQITGRQALGFQATYDLDGFWHGNLEVLQSLIDDSGVLVPSLSWDAGQNITLLGAVYFAYGATSIDSVPQSQFGAVPPTFIVEASFYD